MIRFVRALAWLRWRVFLNAFKGTRRRDSLERLSRAGSVLMPILVGVMFVPAFLGSCGFSLIGGWAVGQRLTVTPQILLVLRLALGLATGVIIVIPAVRTARSPETGLVRLTLLPIPRRILHASDMIAGLADPWILLLVPALTLFPIGITAAGRPLAGVVALLAGVALLGLYLALESCIGSLLALLYRDRRRGEVVTLVVLLALSTMGFIPAMLSRNMEDAHRRARLSRHVAGAPAPNAPPVPGAAGAREGPPPEAPGSVDRAGGAPGDGSDRTGGEGESASKAASGIDVRFPAALSWLPSELYARALFDPLEGRLPAGLLAMLGVAALGTALYGVSWSSYRRLLDSPENVSRRRGARSEPSMRQLPGLSPAASAVALAQIRLVLRTVHGKMTVWFTPLSILVAGFMLSRIGQRDAGFFAASGPYTGPLMAYGGATLALFAPQKILLNIFALDGAGLTLELLSPISERELVAGKAAGMALLSAIPLAIITTISMILAPAASPWLWGAVLVSAASTYFVLAPVSTLISAIFPKTADLNRLSSASNPNGIAQMLGIALTILSCAPPALVTAGVLLATGHPSVAFLAAVAWLGVAAAIGFAVTRLAAQVVAQRRENLALVASGR